MATTTLDYPTQIKRPAQGTVVGCHDDSGNWRLHRPDGTLIDTSSSTTGGLQEAINYAAGKNYNIDFFGGWDGVSSPELNCTSQITIPTGALRRIHLHNVNLWFRGLGAGVDGVVFDSGDLFNWMHTGQLVYAGGTGAAIRFNPTHNNGENFVGLTSSNFWFPVVVLVQADGTTLSTASKGLRFSMPYTGGYPVGSGLIVNCEFHIQEVNGGAGAIDIDDPGSSGGNHNEFKKNFISSASIHSQSTFGIRLGQSSTGGPYVHGNTIRANIGTSGVGLDIWGQANIIDAALEGTTGFRLNASAKRNELRVPENLCGTKFINSADVMSNILQPGGEITWASITAPGSGVAFQNQDLVDWTLSVTLGTVSAIEMSPDQNNSPATWLRVASASNCTFTVPAGCWCRIAYAVAPNITKMYRAA